MIINKTPLISFHIFCQLSSSGSPPNSLPLPLITNNGGFDYTRRNPRKQIRIRRRRRRRPTLSCNPDPASLPTIPPSAVESNFARYYAADFLKPGHDQYIYRHANGLCVIGLAPTHVAFKEEGGITAVDFNVGRSNKSEIKVTGKRKRNAQHLEPNSGLCKVCANGASYIVRCCVKGSLLEVNDRLIKQPDLLNSLAAREGYIAIIMPKPTDWLKIKDSLLSHEDYQKLRGLC